MKKILTIFICFIMCVSQAYAKDKNDNYSLKINGEKYTLLFSAKDKETNGYLNEYFKRRETYNTWSEMVAIHHFPNAYSPIDQVRQFREYLGSISCPSALTFDDKKNTAMIDFVMISEHRIPVILEFNIFKFEKSKECGSVAIQYAKRYSATTAFEVEAVKQQFEKDRKKMIVKVKNMKIPDVVLKEIDKCKFEMTETAQDENKTENYAVTPVEEEKAEETPSADEKKDIKEQKNEEEIKEDKKSEDIVKSKENKEEEQQQKKVNESAEKSNITTERAKETSSDEENNKETKPEKTVTDINEKGLSSKSNNKKAKEASYKVVNTKDDYVAKPRTKKELKEITDKIKKEQKMNAKKRAKKASKKLNGD